MACGGEVRVGYARDPFSTDRPDPGPFGGMLVVSNFADDTLSFVDPVTRLERARVPVGLIPIEAEGPHHVAVDPRGDFLYVNLSLSVPGAGSGPHNVHARGTPPGFLLKLSTKNGRLVGQAQVDRNPGDNLISADGRTVYVSHFDLTAWTRSAQTGNPRDGDSQLAVIDAATMTVRRMLPICPAAHGMALSASGDTLFVACGADEIATLATQDPTAQPRRYSLPGTREGPDCGFCPYAVGVAPDARVWVASLGPGLGSHGRGRLHVFDPVSGLFDPDPPPAFSGRAMIPGFVRGGSGGYRVLVPEQGDRGDFIRVYRVDVPGAPAVAEPTLELLAECINAHAVTMLPDGQTAVVVCEGDYYRRKPGTLVFIDTAMMQVTGFVEVGLFPDDVKWIPSAPSP